MKPHPFRLALLALMIATPLGAPAQATGPTKQLQDYNLVVHKVQANDNSDTVGARRVLNDTDYFYRVDVYNSSSAPAQAIVKYVIYHKTNVDRSGNTATHETDVTGAVRLNLPPHSNQTIQTKTASGRDLKMRGRDNEVTGEVLGVWILMKVNGKVVDSYENPLGIHQQMKDQEGSIPDPKE
jgi:hypothetical protein